jgi:hypothetical protein
MTTLLLRLLSTCACVALVLAPPAVLAAPLATRVPPAVAFDLQGFIDARVAAGEKTVVIPPGRHLVTPRNKQHLLLRGLRDIVIEATGAELVCTETTRAITIEDCENLTLRGLVIDYDPLPFAQARITAISEDKTRLTLQRIPGYGELTTAPYKLETFDPATNELRGRLTYYGITTEVHSPDRITLTRQAGTSAVATEKIGDIAVLENAHAPGGSMPHAIMATDSRGLVFENVTLFAGPTFGFFENNCDGSRYIGCRVDRRPPELDYATRGHPRMRSQNADAFHSKNARVGPLYDRCIARYNGDDSIAINGDYHLISEVQDNTLRVLAKHAMNMRVGDTVQIMARDGRRLPDKTITALAPIGPATTAEREFLETQNIQPRLLNRALHEAWTVTLDAPVSDTPRGSLIASADAIGSGFEIRDCLLGHNRSRGILLKAGRGKITGTTLQYTVMAAILVAPEYFWLEAGCADDLVIANNTLRDLRGPGIIVTALGGDGSVAPAGSFRNLTIRDNTISGGPAPGLLVTSVTGLVHQNNRVSVDPSAALNSWEIRSWGRDGVQPVMLLNNQ